MRSTYAHVQQCFNLNRLEGDGCGPHDSGSSPDSPCLNFDPSPAQQRTLLADPIPNASMVRAAGCCSCSFHWPMGADPVPLPWRSQRPATSPASAQPHLSPLKISTLAGLERSMPTFPRKLEQAKAARRQRLLIGALRQELSASRSRGL